MFFSLCFRYKDGFLIKENHTCYKQNGSILSINDIKEKDAGRFTIALSNKKHGLYKNLTFTLIVNSMYNTFIILESMPNVITVMIRN